MKQFNRSNVAIHYAASGDEFGMELIKQTKQFPNYYHKAKKRLMDNKCDKIFFVPSKSSGVTKVMVATITKVSRMSNYSKLNPLWTVAKGHKPDEQWDMLVELGTVVETSIEYMDKMGYPTKGIQGGIRIVEV